MKEETKTEKVFFCSLNISITPKHISLSKHFQN